MLAFKVWKNCFLQGFIGWLEIANKCVSYMDEDILWAQVAIFTGLFVMIAVCFKKYVKYKT